MFCYRCKRVFLLFIHMLHKTEKYAILIEFLYNKSTYVLSRTMNYNNSFKSNFTKNSWTQRTYINNILTMVCGSRCRTVWGTNGIFYHRGMDPDFWANAIAFSFAKIWNSWNLCEIRWFIFRYFSMQFRAHLSYGKQETKVLKSHFLCRIIPPLKTKVCFALYLFCFNCSRCKIPYAVIETNLWQFVVWY
jgi:hypothetical protein